MATSLDDILAGINNMNQNLGRMILAIEKAFPSVVTSPTATAGAGTLPATPEAFLSLVLSDGTHVKIPYYKP
jgi:hypothetical protein